MMTPISRVCPATGRRVLLAPERSHRPLGLSHAKPHARVNIERDVCPFCPGMEHDTPHPLCEWPANEPWQIRLVPNKFPAVRPEGDTGYGRHWVIIEGRDHATHPGELGREVLFQTLHAYRECLGLAAADTKLAYGLIFKNVGSEAGASLAHSHSQLLATPFIPPDVESELQLRPGGCAYCAMLKVPERILCEMPHFVAACPYAPRFGYETWILPRQHSSRFEDLTDAELRELAKLLAEFLKQLDSVLGDPAYNWVLHTAPLRQAVPHYHWHLKTFPRTARAAGYEWGSGVFINATLPEHAAAQLRFTMDPSA